MKQKHNVLLSIGSNQGDRLQNLHICVSELSLVFDCKQISSIYESPAWGFDSEPFYNAAVWLQTIKTPSDVLLHTQQIEVKMGKIQRLTSEAYQSRLIDIDIVWFDDQIVDLPNLKIPHPHFHNRKFVLLPMAEFEMDWIHPVLNKTISDLVKECMDESDCSQINEIINL